MWSHAKVPLNANVQNYLRLNISCPTEQSSIENESRMNTNYQISDLDINLVGLTLFHRRHISVNFITSYYKYLLGLLHFNLQKIYYVKYVAIKHRKLFFHCLTLNRSERKTMRADIWTCLKSWIENLRGVKLNCLYIDI